MKVTTLVLGTASSFTGRGCSSCSVTFKPGDIVHIQRTDAGRDAHHENACCATTCEGEPW